MQNNEFVTIQRIVGQPELIRYRFVDTPFGDGLIASTSEGVCYMGFHDNQLMMMHELETMFPKSQLVLQSDSFQANAMAALQNIDKQRQPVSLHVKATPFQLEVWRTMLDIPFGQTISYGEIGRAFHCGNPARAVGNAVGRNAVAFPTPCHRVVRADGSLGGFRWGEALMRRMLDWEQTIQL